MKWFFLITGLIGMFSSCRSNPQKVDHDADYQRSGIEGTVMMESDVMSRPDIILADQVVVIFSEEAMNALFGRTVDRSELRFLRKAISESYKGMDTTLTDSDGHYNFSLDPGNYVLCLADSEGPNPANLPLTIRGCGQVFVPSNIVRRVDISSGFGEILLVEP